MNLAGPQRLPLTAIPPHDQAPALVDLLGDALTALPGDPLAAERVAGPVGAQALVVRRLDPASERIVERREGRAEARGPAGRQPALGLGGEDRRGGLPQL